MSKKGGGLALVPARPERFSVAPGRGCDVVHEHAYPPPPGISAQRAQGGRVVLSYSLARAPEACRPVLLDFNVDVNDDGLPGIRTAIRIEHRVGRMTLELPARLIDADVVRASAIAATGATSSSVAVLIR